MDIRMIVTDLDRTLLRSDKTISDHTAMVLAATKARGMRLAYATARPLRATRGYCERVPCDALLCHNGAVIEHGETRISLGIPTDIRDEILAMLLRDYPDATLSMECDDRLWANYDFSKLWPGLVWTFTDFRDPAALPDLPADKILVGMQSRAEADALAAKLPEGYYAELAHDGVLMIMNAAATKWNAVQRLCALWDIAPAQVAAFGDDLNDCGMLKGCGIGVAVENAIPEARESADFICPACDEDGVARWIEENLL